MKKAILMISLVAVMLLSACGTSGSESGGLKKVQMLLAADGNTVYYAYVARDNGYYEEEGLDVELVPGKGSSYVVQQVGADTVGIGVTAVAALMPAWDQDIDIQAVYQLNVTNLFDLFVPKDSTVTDISQLKGKVIGVTDLGSGEVPMVRSILSSAGLDPDRDVTLRAIGSDAAFILTAFNKGDVDAFSGGAHDLVALYASGFESRSLMPEEFKSIPSTAIIANGKTIKEQPDVIEKISRSIARATHFAINDPDAAEAVMKKAAPEQYQDAAVGRKFLDTFIALTTPVDPDKGYGHIYRDSWERLVKQFSAGDNPIVTKEIDLDKYLNTSFLDKANQFEK